MADGLYLRAALLHVTLALSCAAASVVTVEQNGAGWELQLNGSPYFVQGAGGSSHLDALGSAGGNSVRTWGVDGAMLDRAQQLGLTVTMGLWDPVAEAQNAVSQYRSHDALLIWALGNEMEQRTDDDIALWQQLNTVAETVKSLDRNHPVMTVIAEIGGTKVQDIMTHFPALDILGINTYGGAASLGDRLAGAGWTKPYMVTEFGPLGHWEVGTTSWGVPVEQSSTDKAAFYLTGYANSVEDRANCLGSYVFLWGDKQEKTHTWYGMFLPDDLGGNRLAPVYAMTFAWTGDWPANRCPTIGDNEITTDLLANPGDGNNRFAPGSPVVCTVDAADPEGDDLTITWDLREDHSLNPAGGGSWEPDNPPIEGAVVSSSGLTATIMLPQDTGMYRVHVYVYDTEEGAATVNLPVVVDASVPQPAGVTRTVSHHPPVDAAGRPARLNCLGQVVPTPAESTAGAPASGTYVADGRIVPLVRGR